MCYGDEKSALRLASAQPQPPVPSDAGTCCAASLLLPLWPQELFQGRGEDLVDERQRLLQKQAWGGKGISSHTHHA